MDISPEVGAGIIAAVGGGRRERTVLTAAQSETKKCHLVGGGDALYTNDILGLSGFGCKYSCNFCELPNDLFYMKPGTDEYVAEAPTKRSFDRARALSHAKPDVWPLLCPCCGEISEEQWKVEQKKEKGKNWHQAHALKHFGQRWGYTPLLNSVDHIDHVMCVLHVLLCISGTIYKLAIAANVENETQASAINTYLHGILKVMSKGEAATLLKRPSFVGSEAPKVLEEMEMLMHLVNYNSTANIESRAARSAERLEARMVVVGDEEEDEWGPALTDLQKKQLKATQAFITFYKIQSVSG